MQEPNPERVAMLAAGDAGLISRPLPGSIVGERVAGPRLQSNYSGRGGRVAPE